MALCVCVHTYIRVFVHTHTFACLWVLGFSLEWGSASFRLGTETGLRSWVIFCVGSSYLAVREWPRRNVHKMHTDRKHLYQDDSNFKKQINTHRDLYFFKPLGRSFVYLHYSYIEMSVHHIFRQVCLSSSSRVIIPKNVLWWFPTLAWHSEQTLARCLSWEALANVTHIHTGCIFSLAHHKLNPVISSACLRRAHHCPNHCLCCGLLSCSANRATSQRSQLFDRDYRS